MADLYLLSFTVVFTYVMINTMIAVNESSYFSTRPQDESEAHKRRLP